MFGGRGRSPRHNSVRLRLKCDGTRAETRFRLSAKRKSPFKPAGGSVRLLAAEVCASAVVMLDTPCSEVVWRVLATHSIRQFPRHFPFRASPCAITFQLDSTTVFVKMLWSKRYSAHVLAVFRRNCLRACLVLGRVALSLNLNGRR